jgi:hypothetical protein
MELVVWKVFGEVVGCVARFRIWRGLFDEEVPWFLMETLIETIPDAGPNYHPCNRSRTDGDHMIPGSGQKTRLVLEANKDILSMRKTRENYMRGWNPYLPLYILPVNLTSNGLRDMVHTYIF